MDRQPDFNTAITWPQEQVGAPVVFGTQAHSSVIFVSGFNEHVFCSHRFPSVPKVRFSVFFLSIRMTDDLGHYTTTYQVYSKNPGDLHGILGLSDVINWQQHLQIQGERMFGATCGKETSWWSMTLGAQGGGTKFWY